MARTPDVVPESQSQTQEAAPKAKAPKKGILAGGVEYASVPELRKKARELKLVAATPTALKALCIEVLNEYEQVQKLRSALDPSFTTEDVPEDEDEDEAAADADDGASGASDDDDDSASEGATIEDLGKVGKLPSALSFGTDAEKKGAARLLYRHLRGSPDTAYMLGLCGGDDKREQLVYCAARLHRHLATNGAVLSDSIATQELLVAAPFFPAGIVADNKIHARATAAAAGAGGGAGGAAGAGGAGGAGADGADGDGDGDDSGSREAIFTLDDFARLISVMVDEKAEEYVSAYRASLSREQLDTRMRNSDLFKGIAVVFNDSGNYMIHPDEDHEICGAMDPNSDAGFEKVRSGETLAKKWCEIKGHYSPVHHNFTKVRARPPRGYEVSLCSVLRQPPYIRRPHRRRCHRPRRRLRGRVRAPRRRVSRHRPVPPVRQGAKGPQDHHVLPPLLLRDHPGGACHQRAPGRRARQQHARGRWRSDRAQARFWWWEARRHLR